MKLSLLLSLVALAGFSSSAAPSIGSVSVARDELSGVVTVDYVLSGEVGVVTVDVQTNGVSIGHENIQNLYGDINVCLTSTGAHSFTWNTRASWPDHFDDAKDLKIVLSAWPTNSPPDYAVMWLGSTYTSNLPVRFYPNEKALPYGGVTNELYKTQLLALRRIPAAGVVWRMGSPSTEEGHIPYSSGVKTNETARLVRLSEDYYMGVYEFTGGQLVSAFNGQPGRNHFYTNATERMLRPLVRLGPANWFYHSGSRKYGLKSGLATTLANMHNVTGSNGDGYCKTLSDYSGGLLHFDLPTEAQWEYACRAGTGDGYQGQDLDEIGRYADNGGIPKEGDENYGQPVQNYTYANGPAPVGSYKPNAWGLYDMLGNVAEWCLDLASARPAPESPDAVSDDYVVVGTGNDRVVKGGSWQEGALRCRSAARSFRSVGLGDDGVYETKGMYGFRLCCPALLTPTVVEE